MKSISGCNYSNLNNIVSKIFNNVDYVENCNFDNSILLNTDYELTTSSNPINIKNLTLDNCSFKDFCFTCNPYDYYDGSKVKFTNVIFKNCKFDNSKIANIRFINCTFININFKNISLYVSNFKHCIFNNISFNGGLFKPSVHSDLEFYRCEFNNVGGSDCGFQNVYFEKCNYDVDSINTFKRLNSGSIKFSQTNLNMKFHDKNAEFTEDDLNTNDPTYRDKINILKKYLTYVWNDWYHVIILLILCAIVGTYTLLNPIDEIYTQEIEQPQQVMTPIEKTESPINQEINITGDSNEIVINNNYSE